MLKDGKAHAGRCEVTKGEPGNPHAPKDVERKFHQLATPVWGGDRARELYQACMRIETIPDLRLFN